MRAWNRDDAAGLSLQADAYATHPGVSPRAGR